MSSNLVDEPPRALMLDVNRTQLRAWDWGPEDGAPIVCAHGAYDHGRMFDQVAAELEIGEALLLGTAGIICGGALGILLGSGLVKLVLQTINDLYYNVNIMLVRH